MEQTIGQPVGQTGILRTLNIKKMIKRLLLTSTLLASSALAIQAQDLFLSEGQYYTDGLKQLLTLAAIPSFTMMVC